MNTKVELEEQHSKLVLRIKQLESDLETPIDKDEDESGLDLKNREILYSLYEVEKKNLERIEGELFNLNS